MAAWCLPLFILLRILASPARAQSSELPFAWGFPNQDDTSSAVQQCQPLAITLYAGAESLSSLSLPLKLFAYPESGVPSQTTLTGSGTRWEWSAAAYAAGSKIEMAVVDSNGANGGWVGPYTVADSSDDSCLPSSSSSAVTVKLNATSVDVCDTLGISVSGGTPPYTLNILPFGTISDDLNFTMPSSDKWFSWVANTTSPNTMLVGARDSTGAFAAVPPAVAITGSNATCHDASSASPSQPAGVSSSATIGSGSSSSTGGATSGAAGSSASSGKHSNAGVVAGGVVGGLVAAALLAGLLWFCLRRRKEAARERQRREDAEYYGSGGGGMAYAHGGAGGAHQNQNASHDTFDPLTGPPDIIPSGRKHKTRRVKVPEPSPAMTSMDGRPPSAQITPFFIPRQSNDSTRKEVLPGHHRFSHDTAGSGSPRSSADPWNAGFANLRVANPGPDGVASPPLAHAQRGPSRLPPGAGPPEGEKERRGRSPPPERWYQHQDAGDGRVVEMPPAYTSLQQQQGRR